MPNVFRGIASEIESNLNKVNSLAECNEPTNQYPTVQAVKDALANIEVSGDVQLEGYATEDFVNNALKNKVDKEEGKDLSTNDFTDDAQQILSTAVQPEQLITLNGKSLVGSGNIDIIGKKSIYGYTSNADGTTTTIAGDSEIFNDYFNNYSVSKYSHTHGSFNANVSDMSFATGYQNIAGSQGFKILDISRQNANHLNLRLGYKYASNESPITVGDIISFQISNCYDFAATVTQILHVAHGKYIDIEVALDQRYLTFGTDPSIVVDNAAVMGTAYIVNEFYKNRYYEQWRGAGTQADPIILQTADDLKDLSTYVGKGESFANVWFALDDDIIFNNNYSDYMNWNRLPPSNKLNPIGNGTTAFRGNIDGRNHCIYGIYINQNAQFTGLFGQCDNSIIKNLHIKNSFIIGGTIYVGGIAGCARNTTFDTCSFDGYVYSSNASNYNGATGGILGVALQNNTLVKCWTSGKLDAYSRCGGLIGSLNQPNTTNSITDCYSAMEITGIGASDKVGAGTAGLVGFIQGSNAILNITDSFFVGTCPYSLSDTVRGPIVGHISGSTVNLNDCRFISENYITHKDSYGHPATDFINGEILLSLGSEFIQGDLYPIIPTIVQYSTKCMCWLPYKPTAGDHNMGIAAIAGGIENIASQEGTLVVGKGNIVGGKYGFSSGKNNKVGYGGFAAGTDNNVFGVGGFSAGSQNIVDKNFGVALGLGLHTKGEKEVALGYFNYNGYDDHNRVRLLSVGNGTNNDARRNAMTIYTDGTAELQKQGTTDNSIVTNSKFKFYNSGAAIPEDLPEGTIIFIYE